MLIVALLLAWLVLSLPVALLVGAVLGRGAEDAPAPAFQASTAA